MKMTIIVLVLGAFCFLLIFAFVREFNRSIKRDAELLSGDTEKPPSKPVAQQTTFEDLLDAISWVESRDDPNVNVIGDGGGAVGIFQIHKIYVDDVNRIICKHRMHIPTFAYEDRLDREKSRLMVTIYLEEYGGIYLDWHKLEKWSRLHNAGPEGWRNDPNWFVRNRGYSLEHAKSKIANAKAYWAKVKASLEECP